MPKPTNTFRVPKLIVWYGLLQTTARTTESIEAQLLERTGVTLSSLELLGHLHAAVDKRRRMNELADELLLSRGGATRLIARLEKAGYVRRERPPEDQRAVYAVLTDAGTALFSRAYPVFDELIDQIFLSALTDHDVVSLNQVWSKVLRSLNADCYGLIEDLEKSANA